VSGMGGVGDEAPVFGRWVPRGPARPVAAGIAPVASNVHCSGEFLAPMRSSRDPEAVGIGYAVQDELVSRALTFAAAFGLLPYAALTAGRLLATGRCDGGRAHEALASDIAAGAHAA
jgi:hypothetical protein